MKILFITTDRYPYFGTSTGIIKKLIFEGEMLRHADNITVLTEKNPDDEKNIELINNVTVIRYVSAYSMGTKYILRDKSIKFLEKVDYIRKKIYIKYINKKSNNTFIKYEHIKEIYKGLVKIDAEQYDVIIPIFGDYDAAIAAVDFKIRRPMAHVILYQVDPFSSNWAVNKSQVTKYRKIEKKLYSISDAIITMPCIYKDVKNISDKDDLFKFNVLELPLVSKKEFSNKERNNSKPICLFSGLIYGNIRDPRYTIRLFRDLIEKDMVELWFVGVNYDQIPIEFKELNIKCFGRVPISEANLLIAQADVLINIGNLMNNQVPSKIFDYISTGKPIINICKNYDCPTLPYLKKYRLCLNLFEDDVVFFRQKIEMQEFIKNNYTKHISYNEIEEIYSKCTPLECTSKLMEIISKSIKK